MIYRTSLKPRHMHFISADNFAHPVTSLITMSNGHCPCIEYRIWGLASSETLPAYSIALLAGSWALTAGSETLPAGFRALSAGIAALPPSSKALHASSEHHPAGSGPLPAGCDPLPTGSEALPALLCTHRRRAVAGVRPSKVL